MQRQPHELSLHDRVIGERGVDSRGVEVGDAVPQCDVRRRRFLGLHRDHAPHGLDHRQRRTAQQQLAGEGRAVEAARRHALGRIGWRASGHGRTSYRLGTPARQAL
jgi:hypothetical protein